MKKLWPFAAAYAVHYLLRLLSFFTDLPWIPYCSTLVYIGAWFMMLYLLRRGLPRKAVYLCLFIFIGLELLQMILVMVNPLGTVWDYLPPGSSWGVMMLYLLIDPNQRHRAQDMTEI